ncbi:hypothetical protein BG015_007040 [Linnemannia schmuckeri]|uniref:GTPase activating protein n=1 Tax=Linnemannia schmuckeri TaxID=64567 RepID=A0A9P5S680_9FUNG|nr:hypothetical protein BG015_007040 [Linnemannia schmuckeri]
MQWSEAITGPTNNGSCKRSSRLAQISKSAPQKHFQHSSSPVEECIATIENTVKTAKLYCRQAIKLYENAITKYHSTPGKQWHEGSVESQVAHSVFDTKKEKCKAIYALSGTLNHAIAFKESFILEKTDIYLRALNSWLSSGGKMSSLESFFAGLSTETRLFSALMFPPVHFPHDQFKTYFARFSRSLGLPVSLRDLETLDPIIPTPGQKAGYLFHRNRNGEWSRQYFYILPKGMLMQFAKGKDIQVANLNQTLLRTINVDSRDYVFEICSIEVYLMESILQASTKIEFEEWKAALFYWHPPDDDIPRIDTLKISTPPPVTITGRTSEQGISTSKPRVSVEFPVVIKGELFVLDLRSKPMNAQNKVGTWKRIHCCIRSNGHFAQYNIGETEKPFETIPLAETLRTHIWPLDGSLFSKKHCFSIKAPHDVNYYSVSVKRSSTDQETFNTWLYALKSYAKPEIFGASEALEYRLYRTFWIIVNDGRRLPKDLEAYCEIMLDDQRRARTSTRTKAPKGTEVDSPFWRDSFEFTDLAEFTKGITINVIQAKGSKLIPFGRTDIPVRNSEDCDEGWYPIMHMNDRTRSAEHLGDLRLKLKYEEQIVLPLVNYEEIMDIIVNFRENNVISKLAGLVTDLESFSRNVLRILEGRGLAVAWLNTLIDEEIAEASPTRINTLFRGNTLLTKALDAYMRLVGTEYLDDTLGDILRNICKNKVACEVDPSRLEKNDDLKTQWRILMLHTRTCWRAVTESVHHFPKELLRVFSHLQRRLTEKFSDPSSSTKANVKGSRSPEPDLAGLARYTGVSGFVFLRLICPAILGPKLFYIVREHPEARAHRTLTLIAKSLQGLANLVTFGSKESWMVPMNEFITENTKSLKDFIDQICVLDPSSGHLSGSNSVRSLPMQPPHSPGSTHSSMFRAKNGGGSSGGSDGLLLGQYSMAPLPSPSSQTRPILRTSNNSSSNSKDSVQFPTGHIDQATLDRNHDMPLLPHLIDLGKELAHFSTTVVRVVPPPAHNYGVDVHDNGGKDVDVLGSSNGGRRGGTADEDEEDEKEEEDILRIMWRACWDVIETIQERVQLSVEMEEEERIRASNGGNGGGGTMPPPYSMSKISREGYREGEETYVVYEQYEGHELESFDGYNRGYDSDDESFGQHSGQEQM